MNNTSPKKRSGHELSYPLCNLIPFYLIWQIEEREKTKETQYDHIIQSINLSILLNLNSLVEGYVEDLLNSKLKDHRLNIYLNYKYKNITKDEFKTYQKTVKALKKDINKNTWDKLLPSFEKVFNKKIEDIFDKELWDAINCQFTLRNMLSHGNTIKSDISFDNKTGERLTKWNKRYNEVYEYLFREKLIQKTEEQSVNLSHIFQSQIIDHFVINSIKFLEKLTFELEMEKSMIWMFSEENINKIKNKYGI